MKNYLVAFWGNIYVRESALVWSLAVNIVWTISGEGFYSFWPINPPKISNARTLSAIHWWAKLIRKQFWYLFWVENRMPGVIVIHCSSALLYREVVLICSGSINHNDNPPLGVAQLVPSGSLLRSNCCSWLHCLANKILFLRICLSNKPRLI